MADVSVYEFTLPDERIQEIEFFSAGIHVNVRSTVDERVHASVSLYVTFLKFLKNILKRNIILFKMIILRIMTF